MIFMTFQSVGNFIIPTDELIFFRGVGIPPTSNIICPDFNGVLGNKSWATYIMGLNQINWGYYPAVIKRGTWKSRFKNPESRGIILG